ncbi:MAG: hypothetical protein IKX40_07075 [Thermoguttaceae bacterium]|nr:hypothetical protein [Thermoguttaceae bacterium]
MAKRFIYLSLLLALLAALVQTALAEDSYKPLSYTAHTLQSGAIQVQIDPVDLITQPDAKQTLTYRLANFSDAPVECRLAFSSIEKVRTLQQSAVVTVPANGMEERTLDFVVESGAYSAHYPIHVTVSFRDGEKDRVIDAVRVIETKFTAPAKPYKTTSVKVGGVTLIGKSYTAFQDHLNEPITELGQNWIGNGNAQSSRVSCDIYNVTAGTTRFAFACHPPYVPRGGSLYLSFPLELPAVTDGTTLRLDYACAVRTLGPKDYSDGVTFRVWAQPESEVKPNDSRQKLDEYHTTSTVWIDRSVDLTAFAGKRFNLIAELNPGPKNDTTCDGCYVSGLTINRSEPQTAKPNDVNQNASYTFALNDGYNAVIRPGAKGLLDAQIEIGKPGDDASKVVFNGVNVSVGALNLDNEACYIQPPTLTWDEQNKRLTWSVTILNEDERQTVQMDVYEKNGILIFELPPFMGEENELNSESRKRPTGAVFGNCAEAQTGSGATPSNPARIRNFYVKSADKTANRVYFGHGFVVDNPTEPFQITHGGHGLAASHVGFEFENNTSILMCCPEAPDKMEVDPVQKRYTLNCSGACRLELIPSSKGAFDAAVAFRKNDPFHIQPPSGTLRKRGLFVIDIWGGRIEDCQKRLEQCVAYGVTDAMFIKHDWQRWGYDVRLPDIWGKDGDEYLLAPGVGTYEQLRAFSEYCASVGIPFALHDNYIDYYPDADEFGYDKITFHENGKPRLAWINHGAHAQSYQWRPDKFHPFLKRNLALDKKYLPAMDACFVDVFSSMPVFDFWDADGNFHPKAETRQSWKQCFDEIADALSVTLPDGSKAGGITVSESGGDYLIGSLAGADCQWMYPDPKGGPWRMKVPCQSWERTPWFAAVNHTNFSRHGAGYSDRFNALREWSLHHSASDDYISSEIIGALDLMESRNNDISGTVRKYHLAQHVARRLADKEIESVEFENGNIKRQTLTWSDGTKTFVNRGQEKWTVGKYTIPKYGYIVTDASGALLSGIYCNPANNAEIIESSTRPDGSFYVNGRGYSQVDLLAIQPVLKSAQIVDNGKAVRVQVEWNATRPAPKDLAIFLHIFEPKRGYGFTPDGWYAGGEWPSVPTSQWRTDNGETYVYTGRDQTFQLPEGLRDGVYHVMVGLYDSNGDKRRYPLIGQSAQETRYSVASFRIQNGKAVGEITPVEMEEPAEDFYRLWANQTPASVNGVETLGTVVVTPKDNGWELLPIPLLKRFSVTLDESVLGKIESVTLNGKSVELTRKDGKVTFDVEARDAQRYKAVGSRQ